ncbi:putative secreted protein [Cryptosporidium tyzzeri]|nr:putative secreted protein [Cryptosporidium tyzzeri]
MTNLFADEMKEEDTFLLNNSLIPGRSTENGPGNMIDKIESEKAQLFSCVKSIIDAYWDCTDIKFTTDAVFSVTKLSCDFMDKIMLCAIKLTNSRNIDQSFTFDSILSVLENDDRKHKRAQDVIRSYRRYNELLFAFEDREYIKSSNRDAIGTK